ncbi:hypothetical protein QFC22_001944 [Naganishia vaughanmartiniae]|uniref:Uncharacterized protein n=1 Tax=Naganishia vaughanmartiniae TaxID=1424756 RepID=A0ACC2XEN9_9TREE|nr:hypothetical protein QFC22_001944 [Naganishia vaughanmartiniae]
MATPTTSSAKETLQPGETTASTSYKARLIAQHILRCLVQHKDAGHKEPLMVTLQGPQGSGKTTVTTALLAVLASPPYNLRTAAFSLDDLYLPHDGLVRLRDDNPGNKLLAGRGLPGSHDIELGRTVLQSLYNINQATGSANTVYLPIFDKSLFGGEGDRSTQAIPVESPVDVVLFEGWSVGFCPLEDDELELRYSSAQQEYRDTARKFDAPAFLRHSLQDLLTVNRLLKTTADALWGFFTVFIQLELASLSQIYYWRLEQEHVMMSQNGGIGMTDEQVKVFVDRYLPGYELWMDGIKTGKYAVQWQGRGLSLVYGAGREVLQVKTF